MREDILSRKDEILQWVSEKRSKAFMSRELKCNPKTVTRFLSHLGIEYYGNQSGMGQKKNRDSYQKLTDYLMNSSDIQSNKIRKKLLREHYKEHKCENCGLTEWLGHPIPLELHHIDGDRDNNVLENFELLCPNCHAMTDSYRGRNCTK